MATVAQLKKILRVQPMTSLSRLFAAQLNDPKKAGHLASRKRCFGDRSRYCVYAVHTRFDAIEWVVADAETPDAYGCSTIVRQAGSVDEMIDAVVGFVTMIERSAVL